MVDKMSDNIKIMSAKLDEASLQVQKTEPEGFSQNIVSNINNVRPTVNAGEEAQEMVDPVLAPYHRSMEEIEKMPVIEKTKTVCPECKLIIDGIIYKDGDNVMIRKYCPEHGWTMEKYWEDYDMYMKMRRYNYFGRGFDNPNTITDTKGVNCPFDCGMCERHKSHTGLANVVVTNRCHLSCWYCFFYAKEGESIYEPSLAEINKIFLNLRSQKPIPANAIQITGGEPTMHPHIIEIIELAKKAGFDQIQLNTTGINIGANPELAVKIRHAGVSTLYMSYDGVTKRANPKNHWETPMALDACRKAGIGVVLVPTVIRTINEKELGLMINFALNNSDVVRAVNFQPVSLVGRMPSRLREKQRITIPGAIKLIEEQTNGVVAKEDWFSVPYIGGINKFIESLTGEYKYDMSIHFACGAGTYIFLDSDNKIIPITRFVDAAGLVEHLEKGIAEMEGKSKTQRRIIAMKTVLGMNKFIDKSKQPKSINFAKLLMSVILKHDFSTLGKLQMKSIFLGMMHFQDEYTYDIHRVEKCDIHYAMPDGEVLPFCTFNVFPEVYRDKIQKQYSVPSKEWEVSHPGWNYAKDKYMRNIKELEASPAYRKAYGEMTDYFALPVNGGKHVQGFANEALKE
ncbi:molybdenum cofactor biosynthesis protein A [Candidatus Mancarchaeum acidiphilum]|uniref:Molybdenum cofactor biosynthesis protein A n=1 Tax=Candidatus Mancarchaeum acidiphilum TaxID=1920749 RepID=A0A218NLZ0_9ARCH|nr:radical SAM protein [Candidatus Mancarchaeum acidiphilum]ASI13490.1 molybdenum cofactor biosynthesis protein A [Candidatus Mancarchaeum acidiphilum]